MSHDTTDGRRRARRDWPALVAVQPDSGQSVSIFCRTHGLSAGYFYKQRHELVDEAPVFAVSSTAARADDFISLPLPTNTLDVDLSLGEGGVLRIRRGR
ncbi:MAG: hypothetical protein ACI9W2_001600 [Gammaproteobacteria bacterium]|jgi:hypothetical protein